MSFQAMTWACEQELPAMQKLVLLMLANYTNHHTGQCNPAHETLAKECGMGKTALKSAIKGLEDKGLLSVQQRMREGVYLPNQYWLNLDVQYDPAASGGGSLNDLPSPQPTDVGHEATDGGSPADYKPGSKPGIETLKAVASDCALAEPAEYSPDLFDPEQEEENMADVKEVLKKLNVGKPVTEKEIKAKGTAKLLVRWRQHMADLTGQMQASLTVKQAAQLKQFAGKVGDAKAMVVLDTVMGDWPEFTNKVALAKGSKAIGTPPTQPSIGFLLSHADVAVQLIAPAKPAVTPPAFDKPAPVVHHEVKAKPAPTLLPEPVVSNYLDALDQIYKQKGA